jgi:lysophospholipid hydrolase
MDGAPASASIMEDAATLSSTLSSAVMGTATALVTAASKAADSGNSRASLIFEVLRWIINLLYWLVTFVTITLPTWIIMLGSKSWTLTLNFTTV